MEYSVFSQDLIDHLKIVDKYFKENSIRFVPDRSKGKYDIVTDIRNCSFTYDINRTGVIEQKITLQLRYNATNNILIRLDINGPEHTNLDGTMTERNHVHIAREENGVISEWGYSLSDFKELLIKDANNILNVFETFCDYNKINWHTVHIQDSF